MKMVTSMPCVLYHQKERRRGPSFVHLCRQSSVPNNKTKQRNVSGALEQLHPTPVTVPHCHACPQPRGISVREGATSSFRCRVCES